MDVSDPGTGGSAAHILDNAARAALTGPHAHLAERCGNVLRYPADVSPFYGLPATLTRQDWLDLAALAGDGGTVVALSGTTPQHAPAGWEVLADGVGVQLVGPPRPDHAPAADDEDTVALTAADVPEMLELVERTRPGPFRSRTIELGNYLGIRRGGRLIAMAGERLRPSGWTEISAVCTDAEYRGHGLATRLVLVLVDRISTRGDTPFLHAAADNTNAIRLYESLGFRLRRQVRFWAARPPL